MSSKTWISMAQEVGGYLVDQFDDTVTFLLGAGASSSSGGPSTPEVVGALAEKFPHEFPDSEISAGMDVISDAQVGTAIRPLIVGKIKPHVGYLSIAALAKETRVLIVNLNWDPAVEMACKRLGVKCASIVLNEKKDLATGLAEVKACLKDPKYRVVNLHLHGLLDDGDIRLSPKKTAAFQSETIELLWNSFFIHPTVVAGASLTGERDVSDLLNAASQGDTQKKNPFWMFSRQPERTEIPTQSGAAELLSRNECELNFRGDPFVDFDRIMVEILARRTGIRLKEVFAETDLPVRSGNHLVLPAPDLLRDHLEKEAPGKFLALVGELLVGKSTTAKLLAHWECIRSGSGVSVISHFGRARCARVADELRRGELEVGAKDVVIFDDPFGVGEERSNEAFIDNLLTVLTWKDAPRVIVTASPSAWHDAIASNPELEEHAELVADKPPKWYSAPDLAALADDPNSVEPAMVTRRVLEGVASTPVRVRSATAGEYPRHEEAVIEEKLALLRQLDDSVKGFLALVRFYELSRTVVPQVELVKHFEESMPDIPAWAESLLRKSDLTDERHMLFTHYTDRIAFDRLYIEEQKSLRSTVAELAYGRNVVNEVCSMWLLISEVRAGNLVGIEELTRRGPAGVRKLLEWGPLLLEEAANSKASRPQLEGVLKQLLAVDEQRDFWALRELVYEVVRLWPELNHSALAQKFIKGVLADEDRMGRYCVLEALLYFQGATHSEVWKDDYPLEVLWRKVTAARDELIEDVEAHGTELALMFDALAWSPPPLPKPGLLEWIEPLLDALERDESLKGAVALSCLYHPKGMKFFKELDRDSPLADISNLNEMQMARAAEMIRWHYVHQSRGRALVTRRRLEPATPDLLRRKENDRLVPKLRAEAIRKFVKRMAHFPAHRGWAIHLAFNLHCTAGDFDYGFLTRCIGDADDGDHGVVTAALTYQIPGGVLDQMQHYFRNDPNRDLLLKVMLEGCVVESLASSADARVEPPRFMAGRIPQQVHLELGTEWQGKLQGVGNVHELTFLREVHDILDEAEKEGIVDADSMWELLRYVQRGDLRPLDVVRRGAPDPPPAIAKWLEGRGELAKIAIEACRDMGQRPLV